MRIECFHTRTHTHAHTHTRVHTCTHTHAHMHAHTHAHTCTHAPHTKIASSECCSLTSVTCVLVHVCVCACACVCMCMCMCVHVHVHVCVHFLRCSLSLWTRLGLLFSPGSWGHSCLSLDCNRRQHRQPPQAVRMHTDRQTTDR